MRSGALESLALGFVLLVTVFWMDLLPVELLGRALWLFLLWAAGSTLLVASAGAWVALRRSR
ncbi:MAG TPA: hypothetical protein VE684_02985 [Crenalkalicoccus sp.]|jgi:hypothetical protein|nr:hypothetical protein [Crenalkalicoccus sp.]